MSGISSVFLHLESDTRTKLTEASFVLSSFDVIHVVVYLNIRDNQGMVHLYHPVCQDRVQTLLTDMQNCPFVQQPLCMMMNNEIVDPTIPVWNLLSSDAGDVDLQAEEVRRVMKGR